MGRYDASRGRHNHAHKLFAFSTNGTEGSAEYLIVTTCCVINNFCRRSESARDQIFGISGIPSKLRKAATCARKMLTGDYEAVELSQCSGGQGRCAGHDESKGIEHFAVRAISHRGTPDAFLAKS